MNHAVDSRRRTEIGAKRLVIDSLAALMLVAGLPRGLSESLYR